MEPLWEPSIQVAGTSKLVADWIVGSRSYGMLMGRGLRVVLKLRYIVRGGAVGGTVTMNKVIILTLKKNLL